MSFIYFALLLGALIFFHESGHFLVARWCGIRVLEFSIGFGPRIASFVRKGTEWRIGLLPLGGYVKMLGADPNEDVPPEQMSESFGAQALWKRTLVVLAGPVFNLILPFIVFFFLFLTVAKVDPAVLGTLEPGGVADRAGLRPGDVIQSIDGETIDGFWEVQRIVGKSAGKELHFVVVRDGQELPPIAVTPTNVTEQVAAELGIEEDIGRIQMNSSYRRPVVVVAPKSAAEAAGLRSWDWIVAVDGRAVPSWEEAERAIQKAFDGGKAVTVSYVREVPMPGAAVKAVELATLAPAAFATLDPKAGPPGLTSAEWVVYDVQAGTPAAKAGLQPGDEILGMDGKRYSMWEMMRRDLADEPSVPHKLKVHRGAETLELELTLEEKTEKGDFNTDMKTVVFGAVNRSAYGAPDRVENTARLDFALFKTWSETGRVFKLTFASLKGLFTGRVEFKQMGGPIFIFEAASRTEEEGWSYFFNLMVWLSISLGLINLLPIPVLDGGHLLFIAIEAVKRKPVSNRAKMIASYIGLSAIILLMVMVFKNDLQRVWPSVVERFFS